MNGPAFRHATRHTVRTAIILAIGLGLFYWVIMFSSASFIGKPGEPIPSFFSKPPRAISAFTGGSADFLHAQGWLATGMVHPVVLALLTVGAFIVSTGSGATELERGTLDLILSRPVKRRSYLASRAAASLVILTIVEIGGLIGMLISRSSVRGARALSLRDIFIAFGLQWLLFATFSMIALAIFARAHLRSRALGVAVGIVVGTFFVNFVSLLFDSTYWMRFFTPFHYFGAARAVNHEPYLTDTFVLAAIGVVATIIALRSFATRDLTR
jgi:ABC-2 type transport system permease protein